MGGVYFTGAPGSRNLAGLVLFFFRRRS